MSEETERTVFAAPWGTLLKTTSTVLVVVLLGAAIGGLIFLPAATPPICRWVIGVTSPLILLGSLPFVVRGYTIQPGGLVVRRLFWNTRISWMGLKSAELNPEAMKRSVRLFGNGGGFVFAGWFRNRELGLYRAFVNDLKRAVVLRFPGRTVVVSPDNPAEFVAAVNSHLRSALPLPGGSE